MERRGSDRIRRRMPCTFEHDGHAQQAVVADLSAGGLFLQTDLGLALGSELTLRLCAPGCGDIELRGRVVRRRFTPAVIAQWVRRGVGIEILEAPGRYQEALREGEPDAAWAALQDLAPDLEPSPVAPHGMSLDIAVDAGAVGPSPAPEYEAPLEPEPDEARAVAVEPAVVADPALAAEPAFASEREEPARAADPTPPPAASEALCRADALLIHDGELEDVESLLAGMGAEAVRQPTIEASGFAGWERPPRLIVASGRSALRLSMGTNIAEQGIVTIAVVDSESQTLCGMLRRQGFRYVVRRPVHPEALRLLLGRALFRGRERRDSARFALGCEVGLRFGLRRKPATLLELSRTGCRVLLSEWVEPGARLSLRVPSPVTGNRPLSLFGRVLRCERQRRAGTEPGVAAALRFDRLDSATRMRLEALIAAHTLGPPALERVAKAPADAGTNRPAGGPAARWAEKRRGPRVPHRQEVIALEPELSRVRHTLLGIDLSVGGIRVEPHPDLTIGDRVRIAIYDAASNAALVIDAEAVRDQGARGVVLHFLNVSDETRGQIERVVAAVPQIESAGSAEGSGMVVAEMLAQQPA